jgi:hypothetical protein
MDDDGGRGRLLPDGWRISEVLGTSQADYFGWLDHEAMKDDKPAPLSGADCIGDFEWFTSGTLLAEWWCNDFEFFLEEMEGQRDGENTDIESIDDRGQLSAREAGEDRGTPAGKQWGNST